MTQTIPECLTRTAADDRAEARASVSDPVLWAYLRCHNVSESHPNDTALAAIQRRDAEAVFAIANALSLEDAMGKDAINVAAYQAAWTALGCARLNLTLAQRATLLDCARSLVRLALEVSQ